MSTPDTSHSPLNVLVIGAGQAGLALGYQLKRFGLRILIVDRYDRVGNSWRVRFDSLLLFTPRTYSALPGLPVPGDPEGYPTKDEMGDYLEGYARRFSLPVRTNAKVVSLEWDDNLFWATTSSGQLFTSRTVVLATGAFQGPAVPSLSQSFAADVLQLTPDSYRNPEQMPSGTVLVVGDGATGCQIARELAESHRVLLATGKPRRVSPSRILGRSAFWWMDKLGILRKSPESVIGRYMMRTDPFPGKELELSRLRDVGVVAVPRLAEVDGRRVTFANGETAQVDAVIWATGYRDDSGWIAIPGASDEQGTFIHERGVTPTLGLYHIGRSWLTTRGSALLYGVSDDALEIIQHIRRDLSRRSLASVSDETHRSAQPTAT